MSGDVWERLRDFAARYPEVEADLVSGPDDGGEPRGVTAVVRRRALLRAYERALHATRDPARDRTRDLVLDTEEDIEAAAVAICRSGERPYTTDRIHVLRDLPCVRRPEGSKTD